MDEFIDRDIGQSGLPPVGKSCSMNKAVHRIVKDIRLCSKPGVILGLVGPNRISITTLLRSIYQMLGSDAEYVQTGVSEACQFWAGEAKWPTGEDLDRTVYDLVMARRTHAREFLSTDSVFDEGIVNGALKQVGMLSFTGEKFGKLSIEKKQRVHIALALVQEPKWLIIDCLSQPQNVSFQVEMLGVAVRLGLTTLVPFQDLALAAAYCQRIYVIDKGRIVAVGPPHKPSLRSASAQTFVCAPRLLSTR